MTGSPDLIAALNEALKNERTLRDCFGGYHAYFARWRIHRLEKWMGFNACESAKRVAALEETIFRLDGMPTPDRYAFDLVELRDDDGDPAPAKIRDVFGYFDTSLSDARTAYRAGAQAAGEDGDATAGHLCSEHQRAVEEVLERIEAKLNKVALVGPELYLSHHMHIVD